MKLAFSKSIVRKTRIMKGTIAEKLGAYIYLKEIKLKRVHCFGCVK
jgi:hypothetical protein